MHSVESYKCLGCGASLEFNPELQKWSCHFCSSAYTKEELDAAAMTGEASEEEIAELDAYHCTNCGSELIADETTSATFCLYCKSPTIIKSRFSGKFKPQSVIPFLVTKERAEDIYRSWIKKRLFAPKQFKEQEEIKKITGIYAPFWLFDAHAEGEIQGEATTVRTYTRGDYRYTQTKYYNVVRGGRVKYEKVPVDSSTKLDDQLMQMAEPFDYSALKDFSMQYMSGFMAEKYDVEVSEAEQTMRNRVSEYLVERLKNSGRQYSGFVPAYRNVELSDTANAYTLMPIYLLVNQYKGKDHTFIVNGQTGKIVGQTPISLTRQLVFALSLFFGLFILMVFGGALIV